MNPTEEFEIYQFLCKEAEAYVSLSQLLKDAHLTMEAASSAVADFRKQFQDGLQHWQISNQNPAAISLGLLQALQEHPEICSYRFSMLLGLPTEDCCLTGIQRIAAKSRIFESG